MSISVLGNINNDDISNELTVALLTLDKVTTYENYCKFRGTPSDKSKGGGIQSTETLKEKIIKFKEANGFRSYEEAIREYLVEHGVITQAEVEVYNQAYLDVLVSSHSELKYDYINTKEFKAIVAAFCLSQWKFDTESRRILNNFSGIEATNLAEYILKNSGRLPCAYDFDNASSWALAVCNNIIKHKEVDVRNIIKPKSNIRISSGDFDDFDITSNLELEKIDLDRIKGFDKIATLIYEANKRLFYTSNSGMFYSLVRLEKDRKRNEINKALMNVMTKHKLSEIRKTFNQLNKTGSFEYTPLDNAKLGYESFKKVVRNRVDALEVYEDYSPLSSDKINDCFDAIQAHQSAVYDSTLNKNNDLIMPIPGKVDLKNKGASAEAIHAIISMGLNALDKFINKLGDLGLTILDVPDIIFYDKSYIRRFKSFSDYMKYYELVDELVREDKHEVLTLPNTEIHIIDNENLIPNYEKRFLTNAEYVGVDLVPLKTLLNKSKVYSLSDESKNSRLNENADFKAEFINNLSTTVLQKFKSEVKNFYIFTNTLSKRELLEEMVRLPGKYSKFAYDLSTGFYDVSVNSVDDIKLINSCILKFLQASKPYLAVTHKIDVQDKDKLNIVLNNYLATMKKASNYKGAKDTDKLLYCIFKFLFILNYVNNMLCDFTVDVIRESGSPMTEDTKGKIILSPNIVPGNLSYLNAMKLFQKYKELFELFIENDNDVIKLVNKDLNIKNMTGSKYFPKLFVCHWIVSADADMTNYAKDEVANQMLKLVKSLTPPTLVNGIINYYKTIINKFKEGGLGKIDKFAPYGLELNLMSRQLYTIPDARQLPKETEIDSNGYYVYKSQAVIVERNGNRGYVHSTGNVVFPEHDHRIENFSEPFSNKHEIVAPMGLILRDLESR